MGAEIVHQRSGYKHSYESLYFFAVNAEGELRASTYGIHNDVMQELDGGGVVRGTFLPDGELQLFTCLVWETGSGNTLNTMGYIPKGAARELAKYIQKNKQIKKVWFEFHNTGEYEGEPEGAVSKLNRVRYNRHVANRYRA